jgi:hypothetical protein
LILVFVFLAFLEHYGLVYEGTIESWSHVQWIVFLRDFKNLNLFLFFCPEGIVSFQLDFYVKGKVTSKTRILNIYLEKPCAFIVGGTSSRYTLWEASCLGHQVGSIHRTVWVGAHGLWHLPTPSCLSTSLKRPGWPEHTELREE